MSFLLTQIITNNISMHKTVLPCRSMTVRSHVRYVAIWRGHFRDIVQGSCNTSFPTFCLGWYFPLFYFFAYYYYYYYHHHHHHPCYHLYAGYIQLYAGNKPCFQGVQCCSCSVFTVCATCNVISPVMYVLYFTSALSAVCARSAQYGCFL